MIEKEYYRLDELEKRFDLTFSDIKYLIEKSKIDLVFQLNKTKFIIGGWLKDKGFVGYASVYYSGFAKVTQEKQRLLGAVDLCSTYINQPTLVATSS